VESSTAVDYPAGGEGDARVVLELVIEKDGSVRDVFVVSGDEPFAAQARRAATSWRFSPAKVGERPVASRIRFEVLFRAPEPAPEPEPEPKPGALVEPPPETRPPPAVAREADEPLEVTVWGDKRAPTTRTFTRAEVRELPGSFGDPFRAVEAMPGVTPLFSGVPYFFVRGAPPGNVGYFLDGIRVPLLYHIGLGPSVVHPAIVERVDLYPGGYPARFGRFAGGIVAGETTAPRPEFHGEASVRLIDAGLLVEAPFAGGRGTALVGGRYSYTGLLFSLLSTDAVLEYWDYQARISYDLGPRDSVSVFSFGAFDYLGEKQPDGDVQALLSTEFHRVDLRWDHVASRRTTTRLALALGYDRTRSDDSDRFFVRDRSLALRSEVKHRASKQALVRSGADVSLDYYDVLVPELDPEDVEEQELFERLFPRRSDLATGIWGDIVLDPEPGVTVTPGIRADLYSSNGDAAIGIDPRISARFSASETVHLIHALGIAHQAPSFVVPVPGFQIAGLDGGLQRSVQSSAGVELDLPEDTTASLTLFQNAFFEMTDSIGAQSTGSDADQLSTRSLGSAVGAEVLLKRPLTKRFGGFLSYTISQSLRSLGREKFPSAFDRTHVLNVAAAYDLGRRWRAGTRFVFYSGFPINEVSGDRLRSRHPDRVRPFYRVDARLEKRWRLGDRGYWSFVIEVLNATLSKEVVEVQCDSAGCEEEEIGPVTIPSIGLEAVW
jgi:TonB family protein